MWLMGTPITYYDDINCRERFKKHLGKGFKNIYAVKLEYRDSSKKNKTFSTVLNYGRYQIAKDRCEIENCSMFQDPAAMRLLGISLVVQSYLDGKKVGEELMFEMNYNPSDSGVKTVGYVKE